MALDPEEAGISPEEREKRLTYRRQINSLRKQEAEMAQIRRNSEEASVAKFGARLTAKVKAWQASHPGSRMDTALMRQFRANSFKNAFGSSVKSEANLKPNVRSRLTVVSAGKRKTKRNDRKSSKSSKSRKNSRRN